MRFEKLFNTRGVERKLREVPENVVPNTSEHFKAFTSTKTCLLNFFLLDDFQGALRRNLCVRETPFEFSEV